MAAFAMCYIPGPFRDKPLGAPASVKLVYYGRDMDTIPLRPQLSNPFLEKQIWLGYIWTIQPIDSIKSFYA